jgi:SAM-dependent methyltransferase
MQQGPNSEPLAMEFDRPLEVCPLCSFPSPRSYDRDHRGVAISACPACGVKFMNPQYTDAYLAKFYSDYIPLDRPFGDGPKHEAIAQRRRVENYERIEQFVSVGRLLAIGCGDGLELKIAKQRGWNAEGYDVDASTTEHLARSLDLHIYSGDLYELGLPSEGYDCIYLDQVIEHPKQPQKLLREVHRLLRPGGVLYIGCPNIASLSSTSKHVLERLGIRRRNRGRYYNTEHHLFFYSPGVLRQLLERVFGFRILRVQGDPLSHKVNSPNRLSVGLQRRVPCLGSTFQVFAAKL